MKQLKFLSIPYTIWMSVFVIIPLILIVLLSISNYSLFFETDQLIFSTSAFEYLTKDYVITAITNSVKYALSATLITLLIGYPTAYALSRSTSSMKQLIVSFIILPVWTNMLLRIYAWEKLFYPNSILNQFGISLDLIGTDLAINIGLVSMYLPFMVLPIYTVLEQINPRILDAAKDLGASPFHVFRRIILPLSMSGVVSGIIMTFLPALTTFALPERLSQGTILFIGNLIEDYFISTTSMFHVGALISLLLMIVITFLYIGLLRFDKEGDTLL
jgi:spermidine/putrescine transport system permease protein